MHKYAIEIFYSDDDNGYIAVVPELAGCPAFGESEEQALQEIKTAIELWLSTARKLGREIPTPRGRGVLRDLLDERLRPDATSCE
ncbi:type II toxin-antitoxin system HicB family antitoxin [Methanoregula sp.]|uniref:type II toxin-antitoxin system HicB family antitoxin n=1 Tax=Methanoregula sp. TaxID=2052170 RepID=UPI002614A787|nr:type II toxin-antitoxin system HicB family antitoxin [Methanoregula sp.]MDD5143969.1 type II toxin-antitoxin system HicB family antitoxin [Methanoregula sp.]